MVRALSIASKARKALQSSDLLKVLRSEIINEVAADRFNEPSLSGSIDQFAIEHDSRDSQDVVLRKKSDSGEEVVVSALLSQEVVNSGDDGLLPREALMKVCVKKPGVSSILQFNCGIAGKVDGSEMYLNGVFLLPSAAAVGSLYRGPDYETLDSDLQIALVKFLRGRGIDEGFSSWLLLYLHRKEQGQYVDWLRKIEAFVTPDSQGFRIVPHKMGVVGLGSFLAMCPNLSSLSLDADLEHSFLSNFLNTLEENLALWMNFPVYTLIDKQEAEQEHIGSRHAKWLEKIHELENLASCCHEFSADQVLKGKRMSYIIFRRNNQ
ncbi:unnamed protein product [Rhodiola kirilowii]